MPTGTTFDIVILTLSLVVSCFSYLLVVGKDRSWINWLTPFFVLALGSRYVFPLIYLVTERDPGGSRYAYLFCYTTYALSALSAALAYSFLKPIKLRPSPYRAHGQDLESISWLLLLVGYLFYLPILIEFRAYLAEPRRIYELTRSGYGIYFFTSTLFATVGFLTYLFHKPKRPLRAAIFYSLIGALTFWHGSKGQMINYVLIWMLYLVYVGRKQIRAIAAVPIMAAVVLSLAAMVFFFSSAADIYELVSSLTNYSDGTRHAMVVIDDLNEERYFGRLTLENEVYTRIPRAVMPSKPKAYGGFLVAKIYDPANYRNDEGTDNFDIGVPYADFGPFSMILICIFSAGMAWMVSSFAADLRSRPTPGRFIVFLFLAGVNVIPISGIFFLPETMFVAGALSIALRFRFMRARSILPNGISSVA